MRRIIPTICQMCYFYCGLSVTVEDDRVLRIDGNREHPVGHGRVCAKALASAQILTDPARLQTPLKRIGERGSGEWQPITWEEALEVIAGRLVDIKERYGPECVGFYRGQAPGWDTSYKYVFRFMNTWGSPNIFTHANLCFTPRAVAHAATFGAFPEPDYDHANCIALFGYNPMNTSPVNYGARIIWAKERGAKLIVVDPRFSNTAAKADLFLQPRPGTTGAVVLAMLHEIIRQGLYDADFVKRWTVGFDELKQLVEDYPPERAESISWVPADKIQKAARMMAMTPPLLVVDGNGLDMHTNTVQTVRSTSVLRALLRTVDEPGGSILMPPLPFVDVLRRDACAPEFEEKAVVQYPLFYRASKSMTGVEVLDSIRTAKPFAMKALIVQGGDPVAVLSDTNSVRDVLKRLDLLVVHDLYHTATAQIADVVLPAASFLERDLVLQYRYRPFADGNVIAMQNLCVQPIGESKSDLDFIFALARKVGLEEYFPWASVNEAFDWELAANGISVKWLREHPGGFVRRYSPDELYRKYEREGFHTPSGKIELAASAFADLGLDPLPEYVESAYSSSPATEDADRYPMICSTGLKLGVYVHTQFRTLPWLREIEPDPFGEIHPDAAAALGIDENDWMTVESPQGTITVRARIRATVHPRVIAITFGYGEPYAGPGELVNRIGSDKERDPYSGATNNRSFRCSVRKAAIESMDHEQTQRAPGQH